MSHREGRDDVMGEALLDSGAQRKARLVSRDVKTAQAKSGAE